MEDILKAASPAEIGVSVIPPGVRLAIVIFSFSVLIAVSSSSTIFLEKTTSPMVLTLTARAATASLD